MINYAQSFVRIVKTAILATILILLVAFMINNRQTIELNFYPLNLMVETKLFVLITINILIGVFIGFLISGVKFLKYLFKKKKDSKIQSQKDL